LLSAPENLFATLSTHGKDREKFPASFGADLKPELAAFMADSQVPWGVCSGGGSITKSAWRVKPSWTANAIPA
jgi:hypothetical protein